MRSNRLRTIGFIALCALALSLVSSSVDGTAEVDAANPQRPNIVAIVSDDQFNSTINAMPYTKSRDDWVRFKRAMVNTSLCCPSRATMLTGLTSDHTGIRNNPDAELFNGQSTVADWLDAAGYETGLIGKYLNKFPWSETPDFIPSGWDYWAAYTGKQAYFDYTINDNGTLVEKAGPEEYSTDVFADKAVEFIESVEPGRPFFAFVSFFAPHGPWSAPPRHENGEVMPISETPAFLERNVSDKPSWVRELGEPNPSELREDRTRHQRALLAVDDGVRTIFEALAAKGVLDNTIVLYTTDHGLSMGEHRYSGKNCGYEICSRIPLLIRVPGVQGRIERALVGNIDFAPTFTDYAGIPTGKPVDGRSLRPILEGKRRRVHRAIYLRRSQGERERVYSGLRTKRWKLLNYGRSKERELYDLREDPHELKNLLASGRPRWERKSAKLMQRLKRNRRSQPEVR